MKNNIYVYATNHVRIIYYYLLKYRSVKIIQKFSKHYFMLDMLYMVV